MSGREAVDSVRRLAPVSDGEAAAVFGAAGRDELFGDLTRLPFGRRVRAPYAPRNRRRLVLALAALTVVGIASAATWVVLRAPARETTSVECEIKGVDTIIPSTSGDPAHDCAVEWQRELGVAAPPLVAYDNTDGGITVLLRSATPPAGWRTIRSQDVALIELQDSLDDYVNGLNSSCLNSTSATNLAQAKLSRFGFASWTVKLRGATTAGLCFDMDIVDPATQTVTLASFGGVAGPNSTEQKLAAKLRLITQSCESLSAAVASVRAAASSLGLSESSRTYELNATTDDSLRCASVYETVGGTTFVTVRGPSR